MQKYTFPALIFLLMCTIAPRDSVVASPGMDVAEYADKTINTLYQGVAVSDGNIGGNTIKYGSTSRNLAVGPDGTIYALYYGDDPGIRVARSTDNGASFLPSVQVSPDPFEAEINVSSTGIVYVAWAAGSRARVSRSINKGASFSLPVDAGPAANLAVQMATDGPMVYLVDLPGNNVLVSSDNGQSFVHRPLNAVSLFCGGIHVDRQTKQVLVVDDNPDIAYFISSDQGQSFSPRISPTPTGAVYFSTSALSSGKHGRFLFVTGGPTPFKSSTLAMRINLENHVSEELVFGDIKVERSRSIDADRYGNVVDAYVGDTGGVRVSNDLGDSFGDVVSVPTGTFLNALINRTNGDILLLYESGGEIYLNVYSDALIGYEEEEPPPPPPPPPPTDVPLSGGIWLLWGLMLALAAGKAFRAGK